MHQIVSQLQQLQHQMAQISREIQSVQVKLNSVTTQAQQMQVQSQNQNYAAVTAQTYGQTYRAPSYGTSYGARPAQYGVGTQAPATSYGMHAQNAYGAQANAQAVERVNAAVLASGHANAIAQAGQHMHQTAQNAQQTAQHAQQTAQHAQMSAQVNTSALQSVMNAATPARSEQVGRQSEHTTYGRLN